MARYYLWTLRRRFTAQYLLAWQRSVGVFCFLSLKLRVISIRVHGASFERSRDFLVFILSGRKIIAWPI